MPFFSWAQDFIPFHTCFYLANVTDEINSFRVSGELCFRLEPDQTDNMNFATIWYYCGILDYVLKFLIQRNWQDFKKACKITQHANTLTELEVSRF